MIEEIEIQTQAEVQQIDDRREANNILNNQIQTQTENMHDINTQLDNIVTTINDIEVPSDIDLSEVNEKLDNIDTTLVTTQTQDTLEIVSDLQERINTLEEKIDLILTKIEEM